MAKQKFTASAFFETYYSYDFGKPADHRRPNFLYNYPKHNKVGLNLGSIKFSYEGNYLRGNLMSMAGDALGAGYAEEPPAVYYLLEANLGVRLTKKIWFDAGILPSHLGFENIMSKDAWNLTRSIVAESSPYWESGARLEVTANEKWKVNLFYLNGWQRRWPQAANSQPSFGTQLIYTPNKKWLINYSTFAGFPFDGNSEVYRIYNDLFATWQMNDKAGLMVGFDVGSDKIGGSWKTWGSPLIQAKYQLVKNIKVGLRAEYFSDPEENLIKTSVNKGFRVTGLSANLDYKAGQYLMFRIEYRFFHADENIFTYKGFDSNNNQAVTGSLMLML